MNTGVDFEKIVADIQNQVDPSAEVSHNEQIKDRHGHSRQFDVVIRGQFAGQSLLGVIECKDLSKKVGTPEIDAFVTKASDINANFKIIVSKRGFSKPAIQKARHYGIQTLSLIPQDEVNVGFKVGNYWFADIYNWDQITLTLLFVTEPDKPVTFNAQNVIINGKRVIDWFTNYLIDNHNCEENIGWVVGLRLEFEKNQSVFVTESESYVCSGLQLHAKRTLVKKQKFVGINGTGFFDWQQSKATMPPQTQIKTDAVQTNLMEWDDRNTDELGNSDFLNIQIIGHSNQFEYKEDTIELDQL